MKILVSAFEAFGGQKLNSALEVLKRLPASLPLFSKNCGSENSLSGSAACSDEIEIVTTILPVALVTSLEQLKQEIKIHKPDAVLCIGQASNRSDIAMEVIGINCCDFSIPDNDGNIPRGELISSGGADGLFTTLPNRQIVEALLNEGIPASLSYSAGTFVCNYVCYGLCEYLRSEHLNIYSGFMHVPLIPSQVADYYKTRYTASMPSMSIDILECAVCCAIRTIFAEKNFLKS